MTEPAAFDEATTPFLVYAGKKWPVPNLAVRQLRLIRGPLIEMNRRMGAAQNGDIAAAFTDLDADDFDRLVLKPIWLAISRGTPDLTWEDFLDQTGTEAEILAAWFVARRQSGVFVASKEGDASEAGEA